jgi:tetratricopeptide (TPR) repeat protein
MEMAHREQHGFRWTSTPGRKQVVLCALLIGLLPGPLFAQYNHEWYKTQPVPGPTISDHRDLSALGVSKPSDSEKKTCSIQVYPGIPDTVSVTSLQSSRKAQKEYDEACAALKNKKIPETEKHLRRATELYPKYAAGWVILGRIFGSRQQTAQARDACSRASSADANYLPAYLCLAEIAGREQEWNEVLSLTNRALELDPVSDAYAYFFSAIAYFNLNQLPEAETRALKAEVIDKYHYEPLIQLLLAQIYEAKHDSAAAASHLQEYRKIAPELESVKKDLEEAHSQK